MAVNCMKSLLVFLEKNRKPTLPSVVTKWKLQKGPLVSSTKTSLLPDWDQDKSVLLCCINCYHCSCNCHQFDVTIMQLVLLKIIILGWSATWSYAWVYFQLTPCSFNNKNKASQPFELDTFSFYVEIILYQYKHWLLMCTGKKVWYTVVRNPLILFLPPQIHTRNIRLFFLIDVEAYQEGKWTFLWCFGPVYTWNCHIC